MNIHDKLNLKLFLEYAQDNQSLWRKLIGCNITHNSLGLGEIVGWEEDYIIVNFIDNIKLPIIESTKTFAINNIMDYFDINSLLINEKLIENINSEYWSGIWKEECENEEFVQTINYFKPGSEPTGFRGINWGTEIATLKDMQFVGKTMLSGGTEHYIRNDERLEIGAAKIEDIEYRFWNGLLSSIIVITKELFNCQFLKEVCFEKYGLVDSEDTSNWDKYYSWVGPTTKMYFAISKSNNKGQLFMASLLMSMKIRLWEKDKVKEVAELDF
jgi:hypothetical protein